MGVWTARRQRALLQHWRSWAGRHVLLTSRMAAAPAIYERCLLRRWAECIHACTNIDARRPRHLTTRRVLWRIWQQDSPLLLCQRSLRCLTQWRWPIRGRQLLTRVFTTAELAWDELWERKFGADWRNGVGRHGSDCRLLATVVASWRCAAADAGERKAMELSRATADALRGATLLSKSMEGWRLAGEAHVRKAGFRALLRIALRRWARRAVLARQAPFSRLRSTKRLRAAHPDFSSLQQLQRQLAQRCLLRGWIRAAGAARALWRSWRLRLALAAWMRQGRETRSLLRAHARRWHQPRICGPALLLWRAIAKYLRRERSRLLASTCWHAGYVGRSAVRAWLLQAATGRRMRLQESAADLQRDAWLRRWALRRWRLLVCRTSAVLAFRARRLQLAVLWTWRLSTARPRTQRRPLQQLQQRLPDVVAQPPSCGESALPGAAERAPRPPRLQKKLRQHASSARRPALHAGPEQAGRALRHKSQRAGVIRHTGSPWGVAGDPVQSRYS